MKKTIKTILVLLTLCPLVSCKNANSELKYIENTTQGLDYKFSDDSAYENISKDTNYTKETISNYDIFTSTDNMVKYVFTNNKLVKFISLNPKHGMFNIHIGDTIRNNLAPNSFKIEDSIKYGDFYYNFLKNRGYEWILLTNLNLVNIKEANLSYVYASYYNLDYMDNDMNYYKDGYYTYDNKIFITPSINPGCDTFDSFSIEILR